MLLLQTGQKTLSASAPSMLRQQERVCWTMSLVRITGSEKLNTILNSRLNKCVINMTRKQISNIKRSELSVSMLIPSGERCGAVCGAGGWWWARVEGECLL